MAGTAGFTVIGQASGRFTVSANLLNPGAGHTATLLADGSILVAGGGTLDIDDLLIPDNGSETLSPSGVATLTGPLSSARQFHTATLLPNGQVLITGGNQASPYLDGTTSAELYDPATRKYTSGGNMTTARVGHTASLLADGRVLIFGGSNTGTPSAEMYDPANGTFTALPSPLFWRSGHTATVLPTGKVLIAGGQDSTGATLSTAEVYDPSTNSFRAVGEMGEKRTHHTATLLPNGRVLIGGGGTVGASGSSGPDTSAFPQLISSVLSGTAELFDPQTETFSFTGTMTTARSSHTASLLPDGTVLLCGGTKGYGYYGYSGDNTAEIYDPAAGAFKSAGTMNTGKFWHTATVLPNGTVDLIGGISQDYPLLVVETFK